MKLKFFEGQIAAHIKKIEQFYEISGITIATQQDNELSVYLPHISLNG